MWNSLTVEKGLFVWLPWRRSIINAWCCLPKELESYTLDDFRKWANGGLNELRIPNNYLLEFYWICCVTSDYNMNFPSSFKHIEVTPWIFEKYRQILGHAPIDYPKCKRWIPPEIWTKRDWELTLEKLGIFHDHNIYSKARIDPKTSYILLPENHVFRNVLEGFRGRPAPSRKRGRPPKYSDRVAVKCAFLADYSGRYYVKIAEEIQAAENIKMRIHKPYESRQSNIVNQLIRRGRILLEELGSR